jgi:hypothetical protein
MPPSPPLLVAWPECVAPYLKPCHFDRGKKSARLGASHTSVPTHVFIPELGICEPRHFPMAPTNWQITDLSAWNTGSLGRESRAGSGHRRRALWRAELIDLNHRIVARLLLHQMRAHTEMLEFKIGDRVTFQPPRKATRPPRPIWPKCIYSVRECRTMTSVAWLRKAAD